ncbi:nuclear factor 7, ovary-like [Pristis pectinata]|uniref:nuclear factor 7, ovary-like n=1 Tax=Pristis pectinata TaxID=685728 RepID=UPI00223D01DB|nr:nuclear factor 7, ovary-like [Pristis pectinata]
MASKGQDESWIEEVICPICLDFFTDPVSPECGHNFCRSCITRCWEREARNSCPECREEFQDIILRVNRALVRLAEKARNLNLNPKEKESKLHCEEHQEELKLFCETDKKLICVICRDAREHREHRFLPIKEALKTYKDQAKYSLKTLTQKILKILEVEKQQKVKISEVKGQSRCLQSHISSVFAEMHRRLSEKEQLLIRDLRKQEEKIVDKMERNLREIQENLNSIQEELSLLQEQMEQKDGFVFLKGESYQKRRIRDGLTETATSGALAVEKSIDPPSFTALWEILDDIQPVSVTLDVETACPDLEVSEDRKSVRWTRTRRDLPDSGRRFKVGESVLGSEGFTSGRHYWEVEVAGNRGWSLGVAAASVTREGSVHLSPEIGVWTIGRCGDEFYMNTSPESHLPAGHIPGRVGVYLSYESGTVSFYSADTKSHLHTFTGNKFTEKLYPFFWTGDGNWLRICSGSAPDL